MEGTRINKYLAESGYCSRREADRLIKAGQVFINDVPAKLGDRVGEDDKVNVEGRSKPQHNPPVYILFHKPVGVITTSDRSKENNIFDYIDFPKRIFPVGRLDVASSGLLLLTNDGPLANRLMHPRYEHEKEYVVTIDRPLEKLDLGKLQNGVKLDNGEKTLPAKVRKMKPNKFAIILKEGKNRQIRRMCTALGYEVTSLMRTRVLTLIMENVPVGKWRHLTQTEVRQMRRGLGMNPLPARQRHKQK